MTRAIPELSGGGRRFGHLQLLRHDPIRLFRRLRDECGEVGRFRLLERDVVFFTGPEAQEAFFRQADEVFDPQPTSNELMRPIFGEGVVYDAPPERRREMIRSPALRDSNLRASADVIAHEAERACELLGDAGEIDLLDWAAELTIYTSSSCLIGKPFREELTPEFGRTYFELELGTDGIGYLNSSVDIANFRSRDRAKRRLDAMIAAIIERRLALPEMPKDLLGILLSLKREDGSLKYPPKLISGILISTLFAGHHTSAGTLAWSLVEMLRTEGTTVREEQLLITGGCQQSLDLLCKAFLRPGDAVALENPAYPGTIAIFAGSRVRSLGVNVLSKPDASGQIGMDLNCLESVLMQNRVKLILTNPDFQNPTGTTMPMTQRRRLLEIAARHQVPVVEDFITGRLRFSGPKIPSLKALDRQGVVIQIDSFSKIAFPGLRVGWVVGPENVIERLRLVKLATDLHTDHLAQAAMAEFLRRGYLTKHLVKMREVYTKRLAAL